MRPGAPLPAPARGIIIVFIISTVVLLSLLLLVVVVVVASLLLSPSSSSLLHHIISCAFASRRRVLSFPMLISQVWRTATRVLLNAPRSKRRVGCAENCCDAAYPDRTKTRCARSSRCLGRPGTLVLNNSVGVCRSKPPLALGISGSGSEETEFL